MSVTAATLAVLFATSLAAPGIPQAHAAAPRREAFIDMTQGHFAYEAVEYLRQKGMISGYEDGTFRAEKKVNRAEALKIIATQLLSDTQTAKYTTTPYTDVPDSAWFMPYVEWAREQAIIQGPPATAKFNGSRTVTKAEFIKMFLGSRKVDPNAFGDIALPLSRDATSSKEWYYPSLRYAVASSMTSSTKEGLLQPQRELTRGDVAVFLHRFFLYRSGDRTQQQLADAKRETDNIINFLSAGNLREAQYASARGILTARGAHEIRSSEPVVKVAVKIAEGCRALVRAYEAAEKDDWKAVLTLSQDAWYLADQAAKILPASAGPANQLKEYAKSFADQARAKL